MGQSETDELWKIIASRDDSLRLLARACGEREQAAEERQKLLVEAGKTLAEREEAMRALTAICEDRERLNNELTEELAQREARIRNLRTQLNKPLHELAWTRFQIVGKSLLYQIARALGIVRRSGEDRRRLTWQRPSPRVLFHRLAYLVFARGYWMQLGTFQQYAPRPVQNEKFPSANDKAASKLPSICMVTPSYMQAPYLEHTMKSVLDQDYPALQYVVQDGGSTDGSAAIIEKYRDRLAAAESAPDGGQSSAIKAGFTKVRGDVMAWINSDDLLLPGALSFIGRYFAEHPDVDALYGHRVVIDSDNQEVGRWVLPPHRKEVLRWVDYVPQETLFWRTEVWDKVGGVDPTFDFAIDWDLILKFQEVGANIVRVPYFLGCFRMHASQKTAAEIGSAGKQEMARLRQKVHGDSLDYHQLASYVLEVKWKGAISSRLLSLGIRA